MSVLVLCSLLAWSADRSALADGLVALDATQRSQRLAAELAATTDPAEIAVLSDAIAVSSALPPGASATVVRSLLHAALDDDPAARAWARSQVSGGSAAAVPAPASPEHQANLDKYTDEHLYRGDWALNQVFAAPVMFAAVPVTVVGTTTTHHWAPYTGAGERLHTWEFADTVGDRETSESGIRRTQSHRVGFAAGAVVLGVLGAGAIAGAATADDYDVQAVLLATGVIAVPLSIGSGVSACFRSPYERFPYLAYKHRPEEADQFIRAYNRDLQAKLGLTAGEALTIEAKDDVD